MAWRGLFLATAAAVAVLAVAAVAGEEPAQSAAAPAAAPCPPELGQWVWRPTPFQEFMGLVLSVWKEDVLALLVLGCFIAGLRKHRHDWKPLVLGLFALGVSALEMTYWLIDGLIFQAKKGAVNPVDTCELVAKTLVYLFLGLILALAGGLFTVILRWRNERFRERQAQAAAEVDEEPGAN